MGSERSDPRGSSPAIPVPQVLGILIIIIAILGLAAGALRNELALTLLGTVLLAAAAYCFVTTLLLVLIHRKRLWSLSARMVPERLGAGKRGSIFCARNGSGKFFRFPGILLRYEIRLRTRDGRALNHLFDPDALQNDVCPYTVPERGAYYGEQDRLLILDILGLFRAAFTRPQEAGPRLLALPGSAEEAVLLAVQSGGIEQRTEPQYLRTDDLTDHRPYVPGDDPRRINWKLYGHAGDLFVREGEPEPPPHSRLLILIDTQADPALFKSEAARRAVDLLCENALALIVEYAGRGMDISIGYAGGKPITGGTIAELTTALAFPAALDFSTPAELPAADDERGVLVLALPRLDAENSALDRFLVKRGNTRTAEVLFLYAGDPLEEAAETCARIYGRKRGVHARGVKARDNHDS